MTEPMQEIADALKHAGRDGLFDIAKKLEKDYLNRAADMPDIIVTGGHVNKQALSAAHALGEISTAVLLVKAEIAHRDNAPLSPAERLLERRKKLPTHLQSLPVFVSDYKPSYD